MTNSTFQPATDSGEQQNSSQEQGTFGQGVSHDQGNNTGDQEVDLAKIQKRLDDSQKFIEQLIRERKEDRERIEELSRKSSPSIEEIQELVAKSQVNNGDPGVNPDDLAKTVYDRVTQSISQQEEAARSQKNFAEVSDVLAKKYGNEVDSKVGQAAQEIGMSLAEVVELAKKNPKAVYRILGITPGETSTATTTSSGINTLGLGPTPPTKQPNILQVRTEKERAALFQQRLAQHMKKHNLS